jgi:hypothetical protein
MKEYRIWVPGPPRSYNSLGTRDQPYRDSLRAAARRDCGVPFTGRVELQVVYAEVLAPDTDADNVLKPIQDALKGIAYRDDHQIVDTRSTRIRDDEGLRTVAGEVHRTFRQILDTHQFLVRVIELPEERVQSIVDSLVSS